MIIKIDTRETALLQQIQIQISCISIFKSIQLVSEVLPIGDIIINDGLEDKLIIERKTLNDLLSSINDGRYKEQSYRLNGLNNHNHNIIYLIEGDLNNKPDKFTLYSVMFSLNYYKGFSVFRSFNIEETANIICNMAYKIEKETNRKPFYQNKNLINDINEDTQITEKNYVNVIKNVKKDNITPENIGEIMLCQIPGISSITAVAIMNKFKTISNLIKEIEKNNDCMKDLSYTNTKGQLRKINKTCIANIIKFFLHPIL